MRQLEVSLTQALSSVGLCMSIALLFFFFASIQSISVATFVCTEILLFQRTYTYVSYIFFIKKTLFQLRTTMMRKLFLHVDIFFVKTDHDLSANNNAASMRS